MSKFTKLITIGVPGNFGIFRAEQFIKAGMPGFKGVGPKFAGDLKEAEGTTSARTSSHKAISFYLAEHRVTEVFPSELSSELNPAFDIWNLYQFLVWPPKDPVKVVPPPPLMTLVPSGSQIACMVSGLRSIVRVKIGWEEGHEIGYRPQGLDWAWNPGTVFAIGEFH